MDPRWMDVLNNCKAAVGKNYSILPRNLLTLGLLHLCLQNKRSRVKWCLGKLQEGHFRQENYAAPSTEYLKNRFTLGMPIFHLVPGLWINSLFESFLIIWDIWQKQIIFFSGYIECVCVATFFQVTNASFPPHGTARLGMTPLEILLFC